jgi:excisionase family DNA binding protein
MSSLNRWDQWAGSEVAKTQSGAMTADSLAPLALKDSQAAKLCGVCAKTLYLAVRKGELRCVKFGRACRYRPEDLRAWIESKVTAQEPSRG